LEECVLNYNSIKLSDEKRKLLDDIELTEKDFKKINIAKKKHKGSSNGWVIIIEDIYKLHFKLLYSAEDISSFYDRQFAARTTMDWIKNAEWTRTLKEVQALASKKRDYAEIKIKRKETMLDRLAENEISGSSVERYVRTKICINLSRLIPKYEVIVGINAVINIVRREIDIPIVIINPKGKVYRFAVEVDSEYHHALNEDVEQRKINDLVNSNWFMIKLVNNSTTSSNRKDNGLTNLSRLNEEIKSVIEIIIDYVYDKDKRKSKVKNIKLE
jgi:hypothetical protein